MTSTFLRTDPTVIDVAPKCGPANALDARSSLDEPRCVRREGLGWRRSTVTSIVAGLKTATNEKASGPNCSSRPKPLPALIQFCSFTVRGIGNNVTMSKRAVSAGVACLLSGTAMVFAGCGSGGATASGDQPAQAVLTAYTATVKAKTAKVAFRESISSTSTSGSNESLNVTGAGVIDLTHQGFALQLNSPSGGSEQIVETGGVVYVKVPPTSQSQIPGDRPWVSVNLNQVDEAKLGKSITQLSTENSDNPAQILSNLAGVSNSVVKVGDATIDGVDTSEYKATIDLAKEAAKVTAKDGSKAGQAISQEAQTLGTKTLPVLVWVDSKGLVRQISEKVPIPAASARASNGSGSATITMTFSDFGAPIVLTPPPASQVANITAQAIQQAKATD